MHFPGDHCYHGHLIDGMPQCNPVYPRMSPLQYTPRQGSPLSEAIGYIDLIQKGDDG